MNLIVVGFDSSEGATRAVAAIPTLHLGVSAPATRSR